MMRSSPVSAMQKTYDECYLTCSTAIYFEGQANEAEALRSWKTALDQIYHHNAYRMPMGYVAKNETERALMDSLKEMENQCKERVDLLSALEQSRKDAAKFEKKAAKEAEKEKRKQEKLEKKQRKTSASQSSVTSPNPSMDNVTSWLGDGTVPPVQYPDLARPVVPRPSQPHASTQRVISEQVRSNSIPQLQPTHSLPAVPQLPVPKANKNSRSPSPDANGKKTMLTTLRTKQRPFRATRSSGSGPQQRPAPMKAAGMAWDTQAPPAAAPPLRPQGQAQAQNKVIDGRLEAVAARKSFDMRPAGESSSRSNSMKMSNPEDYNWQAPASPSPRSPRTSTILDEPYQTMGSPTSPASARPRNDWEAPPMPPPHRMNPAAGRGIQKTPSQPLQNSPSAARKSAEISYRNEYPPKQSTVPASVASKVLANAYAKQPPAPPPPRTSAVARKPVANSSTPRAVKGEKPETAASSSNDETARRKSKASSSTNPSSRKTSTRPITPSSTDSSSADPSDTEALMSAHELRSKQLLEAIPRGCDMGAIKQILTEVIVQGEEVHWSDVAGLEAAKKALKEAVVYPFLRPDLFSGLREPARGMLLFGPPGTGKTMLAKAVATESKSTFFAISASSLTSKWHGDSEKLVRALFAIAKLWAPSIIFVDEIDSLLGSRGGGSEHEASRRSKTEFFIQWSDLQRAAAGASKKEEGDPTRVLVLAATNCPWDIDDAARRRFVRRQYIPLPEAETRDTQLRTLLGHQKHDLNDKDVQVLVEVTDGYSGSDITALAKDAAMGPLRNLGEALLYTPKDQIRPISFQDFEASLINIRPSVSKAGLAQFEEWATEFGERGG